MDPEEQARLDIDKMLEASGWVIQNYRDFDLSAGFGVAVREYPLSRDHSDYALFIDRNPVGVLEAMKVGWTLTGVEGQSKGYLDTLVEKFPNAPKESVLDKPSVSTRNTAVIIVPSVAPIPFER